MKRPTSRVAEALRTSASEMSDRREQSQTTVSDDADLLRIKQTVKEGVTEALEQYEETTGDQTDESRGDSHDETTSDEDSARISGKKLLTGVTTLAAAAYLTRRRRRRKASPDTADAASDSESSSSEANEDTTASAT